MGCPFQKQRKINFDAGLEIALPRHVGTRNDLRYVIARSAATKQSFSQDVHVGDFFGSLAMTVFLDFYGVFIITVTKKKPCREQGFFVLCLR